MDEKAILYAVRAGKKTERFTRFLDPAEFHLAESLARDEHVSIAGWGGYSDAERRIALLYPDRFQPAEEDFPVQALTSPYHSRYGSLTHRDLLGAFMALGLTRDCLGDIIVADSEIILFTEKSTAPYLCEAFVQAGKQSLSFSPVSGPVRIPEPKGTAFRAVLASLRLDAVISAAYHVSRAEAGTVIRSGAVKVNHLPETRVDVRVAPGAMLSLRGTGRVRFSSVDGMTKKERIGVTFFRFE